MAQQMITEHNTPNITNSELMKPVRISAREKLIEAEYIFHKDQFKTIQAFHKFIFNPANISVIYDYVSENKQYRSVRYHLQRTNGDILYAILQQPRQSNIDWKLIQFMAETKQLSQNKKKKHKKYKPRKPNNRTNTPSLSYAPLKTKKAQGYIDISRLMTNEIIPNKIQRKDINIYSHLDKMVGLQITNVIKGNIWVLDPNFRCNKTGEPLYCMIDKIDPDIKTNKKYEWKMREQLFTAKDIYNLIQIPQNELPSHVINNVLKNEIQQNMNTIKILIKKNMKKIFDTKKPWQNTMTFINDKARNIREKKLTVRKVDYLKICMEAVNKDVQIIPILVFTKNGYSIDGLVRIRIDPGLDIGISFQLNREKTTIKPSGNHIFVADMNKNKNKNKFVADMKANCELVNDATTIADFFDGWICNYNNFSVGDPNAEMVKYNQKSKDYEKCREENQNYKDVFHKLESLNDPIVNKLLQTLDGCEFPDSCDLRFDEKDNECKQMDEATPIVNSSANLLIQHEQKTIIDDVDVELKSYSYIGMKDGMKEQIMPRCLKTNDDMISIDMYKNEMKKDNQNAISTLNASAKAFRPTFALVTVPDNLELQDELMIYHAYMMNNESRC
eukprot:517037_1